MAECFMFIILPIVAFVIWAIFSPTSLEEKLKKSVIIKRNSTFENNFEIWSDMSMEQLSAIEGVVSCNNRDIGGSINIYVDPRVGREKVIDQILNQIRDSLLDTSRFGD